MTRAAGSISGVPDYPSTAKFKARAPRPAAGPFTGDEQTIVDRYSSAVVKYEVKCGELDGAVFRARAGRN